MIVHDKNVKWSYFLQQNLDITEKDQIIFRTHHYWTICIGLLVVTYLNYLEIYDNNFYKA